MKARIAELLGHGYDAWRASGGYRNGYRRGRLKTSEGRVEYAVPQLRDAAGAGWVSFEALPWVTFRCCQHPHCKLIPLDLAARQRARREAEYFGVRFVFGRPLEPTAEAPPVRQLQVVLNWFEELKHLVPTE